MMRAVPAVFKFTHFFIVADTHSQIMDAWLYNYYAAFLQNAFIIAFSYPGFHPGLVYGAPLGRTNHLSFRICQPGCRY